MWNTQDWYYRGEGNANIVFAHKTEDIVLRLAKCPVLAYECIFSRATVFAPKLASPALYSDSAYSARDIGSNESDVANEESELESEIKKDLEDIRTSLCFAKYVMCPLLGSRYVNAGRLVHVPKQFVCHIGELAKSERPENRLHKTVVPADQLGVIMPDFCHIVPPSDSRTVSSDHLSPTICVEIKPKQGFIESRFSAVCRFCMFQHVKLKRGAISCLSSYCPLDLFSGSYERTTGALASLFANPQNNLRIFANGNEVFGASSNCDVAKFQSFLLKTLFSDPAVPFERSASPLEKLTDLIIKVLWSSFCTSKGSNTQSGCAKSNPNVHLTNEKQSKLPEGCVLERILKVQKLGDFDLSLLQQQCESLKVLDKKPCHVSGDYASLCWQSIVHSGMSDPRDYLHVPEAPDSSCDPETSCEDLKRYLVAKTAMDCTVMVSFKQVNDYNDQPPLKDCGVEREQDDHVVMDVCDKAFHFSVKIVDLDPKDCDKMEYYCKQEADMLTVYAAASKSKDFVRKCCTS